MTSSARQGAGEQAVARATSKAVRKAARAVLHQEETVDGLRRKLDRARQELRRRGAGRTAEVAELAGVVQHREEALRAGLARLQQAVAECTREDVEAERRRVAGRAGRRRAQAVQPRPAEKPGQRPEPVVQPRPPVVRAAPARFGSVRVRKVRPATPAGPPCRRCGRWAPLFGREQHCGACLRQRGHAPCPECHAWLPDLRRHSCDARPERPYGPLRVVQGGAPGLGRRR